MAGQHPVYMNGIGKFISAGLFCGGLLLGGCSGFGDSGTTDSSVGKDKQEKASKDKDSALKSVLMNMARKQAEPKAAVIPAPELENINIYARALEIKLRRKYNNLPGFAGEVGKVQLLPMGDPQVSLDGKKMRIRWSQVVFDNWGERVSDLEKEYFEVTFADGKPMAYRTRPTITVGLANEGGYSEFDPVRGRNLSGKNTKGNPEMFDRPNSDKNGLLDDNLRSKNSAPIPLDEFDEKGYSSAYSGNRKPMPVVKPARDSLQAVLAAE